MSSNALALQQSNIIPFPSCEAPVQGKSNEWYTPSKYVEAARKVMGSIDLDPASSFRANQVVRASKFYTEQENGLVQEWYGNVWLNPPYSLANNKGQGGLFKSCIENFSNKLIAEYQIGHVQQAIMLVLAKVDSQWFQPIWEYPICFANHAVKFNGFKKNHKNSLKHMFGTCFVYFGTNEQAFIDVFREFGPIARMIAGPRHETVQARLWGAV